MKNSRLRSILLVTDDESELSDVKNAFIEDGYHVETLHGVQQTFQTFTGHYADLIIVETQTIALSDVGLYAKLRSLCDGSWLIFANNIHEALQVMLYEEGIDDIVLKPMSPLVLLARIRARLRRSFTQSRVMSFSDGLEIRIGNRQVFYQGKEVPLTTREFEILAYLAMNSGVTIDRDQLYSDVMGTEFNGYDRSIDMYISRIRNKIAVYNDQCTIIKTVRGRGYLFVSD